MASCHERSIIIIFAVMWECLQSHCISHRLTSSCATVPTPIKKTLLAPSVNTWNCCFFRDGWMLSQHPHQIPLKFNKVFFFFSFLMLIVVCSFFKFLFDLSLFCFVCNNEWSDASINNGEQKKVSLGSYSFCPFVIAFTLSKQV